MNNEDRELFKKLTGHIETLNHNSTTMAESIKKIEAYFEKLPEAFNNLSEELKNFREGAVGTIKFAIKWSVYGALGIAGIVITGKMLVPIF